MKFEERKINDVIKKSNDNDKIKQESMNNNTNEYKRSDKSPNVKDLKLIQSKSASPTNKMHNARKTLAFGFEYEYKRKQMVSDYELKIENMDATHSLKN